MVSNTVIISPLHLSPPSLALPFLLPISRLLRPPLLFSLVSFSPALLINYISSFSTPSSFTLLPSCMSPMHQTAPLAPASPLSASPSLYIGPIFSRHYIFLPFFSNSSVSLVFLLVPSSCLPLILAFSPPVFHTLLRSSPSSCLPPSVFAQLHLYFLVVSSMSPSSCIAPIHTQCMMWEAKGGGVKLQFPGSALRGSPFYHSTYLQPPLYWGGGVLGRNSSRGGGGVMVQVRGNFHI